MSEQGPRWVAWVLRPLLGADYGEDVAADLHADARRRFGAGSGRRLRISLWYAAQVLGPSMLVLGWKLRRRRGRAMSGGERNDRGIAWFRGLGSDIRQAGRGLMKSPLFTAAAVASLGLGIGANTAIFSVVNAVLVQPPPYREPDRLVFVWNQLASFDLARLPLSGIQLTELRTEETVFEDVAGIWATTRTVVADDRAALVSAGLVTPNFFSLLGTEPVLGRSFTPEEGTGDGATVIISDALWRREFGAREDIVGRTVSLEGEDAVVVGVLPPTFKLLFPPDVGVPERLDLYVPLPWVAAAQPGSRYLRIVGRTRAGVGLGAADAAVKGVAARLRATYPGMAQLGDEFSAVPLRTDTVERIRPVLLSLLGSVAIFLLLTAVNVASLLMARGESRHREIAIRSCLGASRRRLGRLFLAEMGLLTVLGTVVGTTLGSWGAQLLWSLRPVGIARVDVVRLDPAVLAFTAGAALIAGAIAGLGPLMRLGNRAPMDVLRRAGDRVASGPARGRHVITATELALSVVLVVGAALMAQSVKRLRTADLGFTPEGVLTFRVGLSVRQFPTDEERAEISRDLREALLALPGVTEAGGGSHIPLADWANWSGSAAPEGTPEEERERFHFDHRSVTPGYLESLDVTLVSGRFFQTDDVGAAQPVVIVDQALAARAFPGQDPLGRRLLPTRYLDGRFVETPAVVVGVIHDIRDHAAAMASEGQVYWPFAQSARWELTYALRTQGSPTDLVDRVRALVPGVRRDLAAADFRPLESYVSTSTADTRFASLLAGLFSALALLLASLGLYGVISYSAARRSRELGLRLALGAEGFDLFLRVLREGLAVAVVGVAVGLAGAAVVTRFLSALLFGVDPLDPLVFGGVAALLLGVAVVASAGPALRAMRVDPVRSLNAG